MLYDYNELLTLDITEFILFTTHEHPLKLLKPFYKNLPGRKNIDYEEIHFSEYSPYETENNYNYQESEQEETGVIQETKPKKEKVETLSQETSTVKVSLGTAAKRNESTERRKAVRISKTEQIESQMVGNLIKTFEELPINRPCINEDDVCNDLRTGLRVFKTELNSKGQQIRAMRVRFDIQQDVTIGGSLPDNRYCTYNTRFPINELKEMSQLSKEGYQLVGWTRIMEIRKERKDYMYDNQGIKDDGTVKQEKITVPREDITIAPIFRALPGTKKITDKPNSRKQVITDLVNKSIKKSDSNVKSDKEHKKENTDNSDKEYVVKYEELKKISNSANTQTGILNGFKL